MRTWHTQEIVSTQEANAVLAKAVRHAKLRSEIHLIGAFDTETTGLHIIADKPFVYQFGWLHPEEHKGYAFAVDIEKYPKLAAQVIEVWQRFASQYLRIYLGHNVSFDLHMMINLGQPYETENVSDTMFYIRYAHDARAVKNGGPPLKLKDYCARYIDVRAKTHESALRAERSAIASRLNKQLIARLRNCGRPAPEYKAATYTAGVMKQIFSDKIVDVEDLPPLVQQVYRDWLDLDVPLQIRQFITGLVDPEIIPYNWLNREHLIEYALYDIVWTLEVYDQCAPVLRTRENTKGVAFENTLIFPMVEMERVGFACDAEYLKDCRKRMKEYIIQQRQQLADITGEQFTVGQHQRILEILQSMGLRIDNTRNETLELEKINLIRHDAEHPALRVITLVQELRTLEKWYSTYIQRFINSLYKAPRLYTTINQVGTISGRVTSDFQQFPKKGISTESGESLFQPRRMVTISGDEYDSIVYIDYSQIELRFQAFYTILIGHPDLNLCRAYMPYKCHRHEDEVRVEYDWENPACIKSTHAYTWYYNEEPDKPWVPTDVHGAMTKIAFDIDESAEDFNNLRQIGKRVNFAKNYGAQFRKIWAMFPTFTEEQAKKLDEAYYKAFPGVKQYHQYCYTRADMYAYTSNLFGVKSYGISGHNLINQLVQGSSAFFLKWKIRQLYDYAKKHGLKSRLQMQIHDELSWERHVDDPVEEILEYKRIMEDWNDTMVPIVAEIAVSTSTWDQQKDVKSLEEIQAHLRA